MHTMIQPRTNRRMASVREAFRLHRLARAHRDLWLFYVEHNMFEQACDSRRILIDHLRGACHQWRITLDIAS